MVSGGEWFGAGSAFAQFPDKTHRLETAEEAGGPGPGGFRVSCGGRGLGADAVGC
jgi:hypothetical protein